MLAATGILMEQLVKSGGRSENDDNQQISDEQTNERTLPAFGVAKSRHPRYLKQFVGRCKMILR